MKEKTTQLIIDNIFNIVESNSDSNTPLTYDIISEKCYAEKNTISHVCENYLNCKIEKMHPVELCCWISAKEHMLDTNFRLPEKMKFLGSKTFTGKPRVFCLFKFHNDNSQSVDDLIKLNPLIENIEIVDSASTGKYTPCIIYFLNSENLEIHTNSINELSNEDTTDRNKIQQNDSTQKKLTRKAINKEKQYSSISSNFKINEIKRLIDLEEKKRQETLDEKQRIEENEDSSMLRELFSPLNNTKVKRIGINKIKGFFFTNYSFTLAEWKISPISLHDITKRTNKEGLNITNINIDLKKSVDGINLMIMYNLNTEIIKKLNRNNTIKGWCKDPQLANIEIEEEVFALINK